LTMVHSEPGTYGKWLGSAISKVKNWPDEEKIIFLNAWNEWAEGNHLEPDLRFGRAYLEATRDALLGISADAPDLSRAPSVKEVGKPATVRGQTPLPDPLAASSTSILEIAAKLQKLSPGDSSGTAGEQVSGAGNEQMLRDMALTLGSAALELEARIKRFYAQTSWPDEILQRDQRIALLEREIKGIKSSYSWVITKPLRVARVMASYLGWRL